MSAGRCSRCGKTADFIDTIVEACGECVFVAVKQHTNHITAKAKTEAALRMLAGAADRAAGRTTTRYHEYPKPIRMDGKL